MSRRSTTGCCRLLAALLLVSLLAAPSARADDGPWDRLKDERDKTGQSLVQVTQLQKAALGQLFTFQLVADAALARQERLGHAVAQTIRQAEASATEQARLQANVTSLQGRLGVRMRYYQQHGNGGYIGVMLGAHSLKDLMNRAKMVWLILRGDLATITEIKTISYRLFEQENQRMQLALRLGALQDQAAASAAKASAALGDQQTLLATLADQAGAYQTELARLHDLWTGGAQAKLAIFGAAFARLPTHTDDLKPDQIQVKLFPPGAVVVLKQATLNAFMKKEADLVGLDLVLDGTSADLVGTVQGVPLVLHGRFVAETTVLRYDLQAADFAGFPVPPDALLPLQQSGQLSFDMGPLLTPRGWTIRSLTETTGQLSAEVGGK